MRSAVSLFSLWFKRSADNSIQATNHGVDNVLVAQSSSVSNDNFEIGTQGSSIEIYIDSGTSSASTDQTVTVDAGITNDRWYHLALVYGSEMTVYLDGIKRTLGLNTMEGLRVVVLRRFRLASPDPMQNAGENSMVRCTGCNCFMMN